MSAEEIMPEEAGRDEAAREGGQMLEDLPGAELETEPEADAPQEAVEIAHEPIEVGLQRSVRYGRILVVASVLGALFGAVASLFFPVAEGADYELGQVIGLMVVVGGAIGLALGALLSLVLGLVAARKRGAAIAMQTDVR